jgi:hypothetical protein
VTLFSITGRAEVAAAVSLLLACSRVTAAPATARPQDGGTSAAHRAPASVGSLVRVTNFDCEKPLAFPDPDAKEEVIPPGAGIRGWRGGGPMGANWNVYDLRCAIGATTTCTKGKASLVLRVGQRVVAERIATLAGTALKFDIHVDENAWQRGMDETGKGPFRGQPFRTATFRVAVAIDCQAPTRASLRDSNYGDVIAEDTFTAGFASGE